MTIDKNPLKQRKLQLKVDLNGNSLTFLIGQLILKLKAVVKMLR